MKVCLGVGGPINVLHVSQGGSGHGRGRDNGLVGIGRGNLL